ncbi:hypothetical protein [Allohahella sp. A8]|uniref:hypothetical protein n=1 Tax=Allohahella sp. A8 TaxID=3141461 RepID=UPI003A80B2F3
MTYDQRTEFQQLQSENERLTKKLADVEHRLIVATIRNSNRIDVVATRVTLLTVAVTILTIAWVVS